MLEVFFQGLVILLPPVEGLIAQKTHNIVGTAGKRLEEETGFRKLTQLSQRLSQSIAWCIGRNSHQQAKATCAANAAPWERANSRWTALVWRWAARLGTKPGGSRTHRIAPLDRSAPLVRREACGFVGRWRDGRTVGCNARAVALFVGAECKWGGALRTGRPCSLSWGASGETTGAIEGCFAI